MNGEYIPILVIIIFIFWINYKPSKKQVSKHKNSTPSNDSIIKFVLDLKSISQAKFINKYANEDIIEPVEKEFLILNKRSMRKIIKLRNEIHNKIIRYAELEADRSISFDERYWIKSSLKRDQKSLKIKFMAKYYSLYDYKTEEEKIEHIKQWLDPISIVEMLFFLDEEQKNDYLDLLYKTHDLKLIEIFREGASELKSANHLKKTLNAYEKNLK